MTPPFELFVALRYLKAKRKQTFVSVITFISVAGVAVGVMALTISLALMSGFEQDIQNRIFSGNAHITIVPQGGGAVRDAEMLIRTIERLPGVAAASAVVQGAGALTNEDGQVYRWAVVSGVDPAAESRVVALGQQMVQGEASSIARAPEYDRPPMLMGKGLAAGLGVRPGDLVRLIVPTPTLTPFGAVPRPLWLRVAGIFDAGFSEYNAVRAYIPLETARRIYKVPTANQIEVRAASLGRIDEVESTIRGAVGRQYFVDNLVRQNKSLLSALRWEKILMFIVISLIVLVAALNIVSTLILMVMEKVRDIGTLVALGATARAILLLFILQGFIIGVTGTVVGVTLGVASSVVLDHWRIISLDPEVYFVPYVPFRVDAFETAAVSTLALTISLLATIYPAWRASRLDPVEALRHG